MEDFPEVYQLVGKPIKPKTRLIIFVFILILLILATIIFLISVGYINISSPTSAGVQSNV